MQTGPKKKKKKKKKGNGKVVSVHALKTRQAKYRYSCTHTSPCKSVTVSSHLHTWSLDSSGALKPSEWVGPRASTNALKKRKIFCPC
jgi:hypothetical protein